MIDAPRMQRSRRTRNNGAKLIVKHFNTSVAQHFYPIKITTIWNALPNEVVSSRTVNSFQNSLDKHWAENPPNVRVNWYSNHRCRAQFKCALTVVGQRFAGNGPNGLSYCCHYYYNYYYYYYYYYHLYHYLPSSTETNSQNIYRSLYQKLGAISVWGILSGLSCRTSRSPYHS